MGGAWLLAGCLPLALTVMRQRPMKILIVSKWSFPAWPANQRPSQKVPLVDPNVSTEMMCRPMLDCIDECLFRSPLPPDGPAFVYAGDELFIIYPSEDIPGQKKETNIEEGIVQFGCVIEPRSITINQEGEHLESNMHAQSTQLPIQMSLSCHLSSACMPASLADCASKQLSHICMFVFQVPAVLASMRFPLALWRSITA